MRRRTNGCSISRPAPMRGRVSDRVWKTRGTERAGRSRSSLKSSKLPMEYLVHILPRAERDFADVYEEINAQHSTAAREWYVGLTAAIITLTRRPYRCPETPEETGIRHLLYGHKYHIYRVIYRVIEEEQRVDILHIRHGARQRFQGSNID